MAMWLKKKNTPVYGIFSRILRTCRRRCVNWRWFSSSPGLPYSACGFYHPAIAHHIYGLPVDDNHSKAFQDAGDWVGIIFGVYNLVSAIYAFFLPAIAKKIGRRQTHAMSLIIGGIGLISIYFAPNQYWLILSMVGVGIAWASILAMPYAILAGSIPTNKMGVYMGIFNFFIVLPQILNAITGGFLVKYLYNNNTIYAIIVSGVSLFIAAFLMRWVKDEDDVVITE